jgi:hypothetical protein
MRKNILLGGLFTILSICFANAQTIDSLRNLNSSQFLDSVITNFILEDTVKNVTFNQTACTFAIEYTNRTIKGTLSNMSFEKIQWQSKWDDLTLILSSQSSKNAFFEFKSISDNQYFPTLYIHFDKTKIKNKSEFKSQITDAIKQLIKQCESIKHK